MLFGVNIILIFGIINFVLVLFQMLSGLRVFRINFKIHRRIGITLFFTATIHGTLAILINLI
ncbi:MAG TPA: hypothetical protein VJ896_13005 [Bacteroidales bacterium]|nr:hypothetical protein [Bacteroidales bacterium]